MKTYSIKKIGAKTYQIIEPSFKEGANMYLFVAEKHQLLIDVGVGAADIYAFLASKGFNNVYTVITHAHFDHCGGLLFANHEKVFVTAQQRKALADSKFWGLHYLKEKDFSRAALALKKATYPVYGLSVPESILKTEAFCFEIIPAPGHTDDSIMFYDKKRKILISGDTLYDGAIYVDFPNANVGSFLETLNSISTLPIKRVFPGHNSILNKKSCAHVIRKWMRALR